MIERLVSVTNNIKYFFQTELDDISGYIENSSGIDYYFYAEVYIYYQFYKVQLNISYIEFIEKILKNDDRFEDSLLLDGIKFNYVKSDDNIYIKIDKLENSIDFNKLDLLKFFLDGLDFCIEVSKNFQNKEFIPSYIDTIEFLRAGIRSRLTD